MRLPTVRAHVGVITCAALFTAVLGAPFADPSDAADHPEARPGIVLTGVVAGPAIVARGTAGFPIPPWAPDSNQSAWVTPAADTNGPDGDYAYAITFDLTGFNSNSVSIFGRWAVDNTGSEILLNGQPINPLRLLARP